jgi:hypothetical protein
MRKHVLLGVCALIWLTAALGWAADFSQPERDAEYTKSCKRQDAKMDKYFGDMLPGDIGFAHEGRFRVIVTRHDIERRLTLVPTNAAPYASLEELKSSVWGNHLSVGYLEMPYALDKPALPPGSYVIEFDGLKVHLMDYVGYEYASFPATIELPGSDAPLAPTQGKLGASKTGLAYITPEDGLLLYVQFNDSKGKPVRDEQGYAKALVRFTIPGLTVDDKPDIPADAPAKKEAPKEAAPAAAK